MLAALDLQEGEAFKRGVKYEVANGVRIPNLGEKVFVGHTMDGKQRKIRAQVCAVNKGLLSVRRITEMGNKVVFDGPNSYIEDKESGEKIWMEECGGMYAIKLWVKTGFKGRAEGTG